MSDTCSICERYKEGASMRALAKRHRISPMTVAEHLRKYGVPIRPRGRPAKKETNDDQAI